MCNIAGYVGNRPAAPILVDMIRKQEGLNGGCYVGIATVHEGKIYSEKVVGTLEDLLARADILNFPGTVGIMHTRTPGGGDREWGHPFLGERNGEAVSAYVLNGCAGFFGRASAAEKAEMLIENGYGFRSRAPLAPGENAPVLSDGSSVHLTEIMSNLILMGMDSGLPPAVAMDRAFHEFPKECVGLLLAKEYGDRISFCRFNMPMNLGFASHGCYLASAALCFPEDAGEPLPLPAGSSGYVFGDRYEVTPFSRFPATVAPITARVRKEGYDTVMKALSEGETTVPRLAGMMKPLFPPADCVQNSMLLYDILYVLHREGRLKIRTASEPWGNLGFSCPVFYLSLQ